DRVKSLNDILETRVRERAAQLVEANERWDWVVRATNDGVWDWDLLHDTLYYSPRWKRMHGFQEDDRLESTEEWSARIHPQDRSRVGEALDRCLAGNGSQFHEEYRIQKKDGTYFWVLDRGIVIFDDPGRAIRMVGSETDITWRKEADELLREREAQLRDLGAKLLRAQEEERRRISRDLHDDVMQRMGALALELHALASSTSSCDMELRSQIKGCGASAEQLTTDLQRMAHQLHPSVLEFGGLEMAVREQVHEFGARTGLSAEVITLNVPRDIPLDHATCLYRVLQEGLQNVQKHANATTVLVRLLRTGQGLGLCIHDDGRGMESTDGTGRRRGLGLTSMAERVGMLGGRFRIRAIPNDGTELHAWVPLEESTCET
ncbi:MAG: PAS domain-containing protein, partial [Nitrospira sp.]|nr:PAS domain-containing protein [Nitrospira sp.]